MGDNSTETDTNEEILASKSTKEEEKVRISGYRFSKI